MTDVKPEIDLANYNPMDREIQQCPYPHYAALREQAPVYKHPATGMFFVSRLDTVNEVLRNVDVYSSMMASAGTVGESDIMKQVSAILKEGWEVKPTMLTIDPPYQTRYRKLVSRAFSARRIAALEDKIREITVDLIEEFPKEGSIDFHADFAVALPVRAIHYALNMAPWTEERIKSWSDDQVATLGTAVTDERRLEAARGQVEMQTYWHEEYQDRLINPQDDILSDLAHADYNDPDTPDGETRKLEFGEVFGIIAQLMVAGNETTTKFLNETTRLLIENKHWWDQLKTDDSLINPLVEEGLRLSTPNQGMFRVAMEDTELEGVAVPKGSRLWIMFGSANRDERTFPNAEEFDLSRENLKEHIAFGKGHHFCIGAPLSRLEGRVAFEELVKRIDTMEFSEGNTFEYEPSFVLRGLAKLDLDIKRT